MERNQSNVERVMQYMEYGSPLNQMFLIDALGKLADVVLADEAHTREVMKNSFVSGEAWIAAAKDWLASADRKVKCCDECSEARPSRTYNLDGELTDICETCRAESNVFRQAYLEASEV